SIKIRARTAIDSVRHPDPSYNHWIKATEKPLYNPKRIRQEIAAFKYKPKISIVMPVYNTPIRLLNAAIRSVQAQHYTNWELCICDDASTDKRVAAALRKWQ